MANSRIVLKSPAPGFPGTPNKAVELDTVLTSPSNRVLLLPETPGGGPNIAFFVDAPWDNYSFPTSPPQGFSIAGTAGAVIDVDWGDSSTSTYTMTGSTITMQHTYDTASPVGFPYEGLFYTDTDDLLTISAHTVLVAFNTTALASSSLTYLQMYKAWALAGAVSNLPSTLSHLEVIAGTLYSGLTGTVANFPSALTYLRLLSGTNANLTGTINDFASSSFNTLALEGLSNITGTINNLATNYPSITHLQLDSNGNITGSIDNLSDSISILYLLDQSGIAGSINNLPTGSHYVRLVNLSTSMTGSLANLPDGILDLEITNCGNNVTGTFSASLPASLTRLVLVGPATGFGGGDIASETNLRFLKLDNISANYVYSSASWPAGMRYFQVTPPATYGLSATEVNNILIDLAATTWTGEKLIDLRGSNAARTSASDSAVATLTGMGVTVYTN